MKLQILKDGQDEIKNYSHVVAGDNKVDISHITNNECEHILATDVLDCFTVEGVPELLQALVSKLRLGGEMSIGGTEIRLLCKSIINGSITPEEGSGVISGLYSASSLQNVQEALEGLGLTVVDTHMNGIHFEVKVRRV